MVLLRRKTNHCWHFFCFFLSVIHFNRRPSVVCRWHFFVNPIETPWMHHRQSVAKLAGVMCVFLVLCSSAVWRLQHYLLSAGAHGCLCALDVCQGWNKYCYLPSTYLFSSALSASKMLLIKIICPSLFETGETQIQKLVCNCQFFKGAAKTEMAGSVGIWLKLVIWWSLTFISDYLIKITHFKYFFRSSVCP